MMENRWLAALALVLAAPSALAQQAQPQPFTMIHVIDGQFIDANDNATIVPPGAIVAVMSFRNSDGTAHAHSLTADDGRSFDLAIPAPDNPDGYVYLNLTAPPTPGSYPYHSKAAGDSTMHGTLLVRAPPGYVPPEQKRSPGFAAASLVPALGLALALVRGGKRGG